MADVDCSKEIKNFHNTEVNLSNAQRSEMRSKRDNGRTRLENGLINNDHPSFNEMASQGSYQMRTMVQDEDSEYDIDDGVYFSKEVLIDKNGFYLTPLQAREMVCESISWDGRLKINAEVKDNCVRQEYPAGYHIDIPVYRIVDSDDGSEYYELASKNSWIESDARAVTRWFNNIVGELNAGESDGSQMRRVTKLTKFFARSRKSWKKETTSGICITKLISDHFVNDDREDKSLRNTWISIRDTLENTTLIEHPVLNSNLAEIEDPKVTFFKNSLNEALEILQKLDEEECSKKDAMSAWDEVFNTTYFSELPNDDCPTKKSSVILTGSDPARRDDGGGRFG